jgi:hypothetical protein
VVLAHSECILSLVLFVSPAKTRCSLPRCSIGPACTAHPFLFGPAPSPSTLLHTLSLSTGIFKPTASFACSSFSSHPTEAVAPSWSSSCTAKTPDKLTAVNVRFVRINSLNPAGPYM